MVTFGLTKQAVAGGGGGPTYFLDTYGTNCIGAFSVRQLSGSATNAMRIRRASDNTETDIGFDGSGDLDTAAIASHCSGTECYVDTWYDQSGNSRDIVQTTNTEQPRIYNSGAVEDTTAGLNRPAIWFDNTDDFLERQDLCGLSSGSPAFSWSVVVDSTGTGPDGIFTIGENDAAPAAGANYMLYLENAVANRVSFCRRATQVRYYGSGNSRDCIAITGTKPLNGNHESVELWEDGADQTEANTGSAQVWSLPSTSQRTWIGVGQTTGATNQWFQGHIAEVIFWSSDIGNTDAAAVGDDQEAYFVA